MECGWSRNSRPKNWIRDEMRISVVDDVIVEFVLELKLEEKGR